MQPSFEPLGYAPAYLRVSEAIRARILRRELQEGEVMPTETELARQFEVNRSTVREALRKLESAGLVEVERAGREWIYRLNRKRLGVAGEWLCWFDSPPTAGPGPRRSRTPPGPGT